jgi:hypothetical protein
MEGVQIRLSKFTGEGYRLADFTIRGELQDGAGAYVIYPDQFERVIGGLPKEGRPFLLVRLTRWDGETVMLLNEPSAVPFHGGDACLVDLAAGFTDESEIESLGILSEAVGEAHELGLPIVCRVLFNPEAYGDAIASNLNVPLTIAEEIGADCIIIPALPPRELSNLREPLVPYFLTIEEGLYERRSI